MAPPDKRKRAKCRSKSCVRARKRRQQPHLQNSNPVRPPPLPSLFEQYIWNQNWLPRQEQGTFFSALRQPLPVCFRIRSEAAERELQQLLRQERLEHFVRHFSGRTWQLPSGILDDVPRLRRWLSSSTRQGHVSRQEFVSMIPVFLLGIESHHHILDLCASPGSKTLQALDALYDSNCSNSSIAPSGFVVANELDAKRAYVLAHRCADIRSERLISLAVVCHNACKFPNVLAPLSTTKENISSKKNANFEKPFDRIICDVPCSGDGTLRKDVKAWKVWHPTYGLELHSLQVRIAKRGIALLKVGGLMTYSTCSFHPIENEAVVATLLQTGCVEILEPPADALKGIRYRAGLTNWKVLDDECQELPELSSKWPKTCWPPKDDNDQVLPSLRNCIRMVPQDNDTGGFFIALLRKVKDFPSSSSSTTRENKKDPMVTPQADHHQLYPVDDNNATSTSSNITEDCKFFTRGRTGSRTFQISSPLAYHLTDAPGAAKLNLVYAGLNTASSS